MKRMKKIKVGPSRREDIQHIYQCYTSGQGTLPAAGLLSFLQNEQLEATANQEMAESLIDRYEIEETARGKKTMTFEGFLRYMESKDGCVFDQTHREVYQDMTQALSAYFISSSHNTYLTADQLVGESDLDAYTSALRKGCRCLEIDCWDGPGEEPIVYHGYTLTSKILFRDVIRTIEQHAFEVSPYPVILSLENHCTPGQQEVMARYLTSILGEKLCSSLNLSTLVELPSPEDLKYKILIKNKKLSPSIEPDDRRGREAEEEESEEEEEEEDEEEKEEAVEPRTKIKLFRRQAGSGQKKKKKVAVVEALSNLVIYTKSVKFHSFSHSREHQHPFENTSLGEKKARKLAKTSGAEFIQHNRRFLSRIYPAGSRTLSSNYNPQEFWNVGSQLVALNFQSLGLPMDLNDGRFRDNGGCGYVLKPAILRSNERSFNPNSPQPRMRPTHLLLKVVSGSSLPVPCSGQRLDPFVRVEILGIQSDHCKRNTDVIKHNSLSPHWDYSMNFTIAVPELCLVRFSVRGRTGLLKSEFVGQYTLPFTSMKKGYRWVPLLSRKGVSLDPASLFIFVWYS